MQRWLRIHEYAYQYQKWVYKVYAEHGPAYLCTYWNLDLPHSIYDGTVLDWGTYTKMGNLSGFKWRKILYLPVFQTEQIVPTFNADEEGFTKKEQTSSFLLPTEYCFQPSPFDFVKFEQNVLQPEKNDHPLYQVVNFDKATNTDKTFWKVNLRVDYHIQHEIDEKLSQVCTFFDYTKKIYEAENGTFLFRLLEKNRMLSSIDNFYNKGDSLYYMEAQI